MVREQAILNRALTMNREIVSWISNHLQIDGPHPVSEGQRPSPNPAEGNALGTSRPRIHAALKGHSHSAPPLDRPFRANDHVPHLPEGVALGWVWGRAFSPAIRTALKGGG
jgi:hypothetical protein